MEFAQRSLRSGSPPSSFADPQGLGGTIFKAAFRGHHIPAGIMDRKLNEFLAFTQGNRTVLQYAQAFNDLCQYAGYHADTDEKKRDRFRRGLGTKLRYQLWRNCPNYSNISVV
jgi:hypothetical protein